MRRNFIVKFQVNLFEIAYNLRDKYLKILFEFYNIFIIF